MLTLNLQNQELKGCLSLYEYEWFLVWICLKNINSSHYRMIISLKVYDYIVSIEIIVLFAHDGSQNNNYGQ